MNLVALYLRDLALQPKQKTIVEITRVVDAVFIGDQRIESRGQLQQLIPIQAITCQTRNLQADNQADFAQRQFRNQTLIAWAIAAAGAGEAQIVIDDDAVRFRPAQRLGALTQLVLAFLAFLIFFHLTQRRLAYIDDRFALLVAGLNFRMRHDQALRDVRIAEKTAAHAAVLFVSPEGAARSAPPECVVSPS